MAKKPLPITEKEIAEVRGHTSYDRILEAAKLIHRKTGNPEDVTVRNVMDVTGYNDSKMNRIIMDTVGAKISRLSPPPIHYVREAVGAYTGNLEEASVVWPKFKPSQRGDWIRSVKLPLTLGKDESRLLGVYLGDAHLSSDENTNVTVTGTDGDKEFYTDWVAPMIRSVHNLPAEVHDVDRVGTIDGKTHNYKSPTIRMPSAAIHSWLKRDLGFSNNKAAGRPLPAIPEDISFDEHGFVEGALASLGTPSDGHLHVKRADGRLVKELYEMATKSGLSMMKPTQQKSGVWYRRGAWYTRVMNESQDEVELLNPRHREALADETSSAPYQKALSKS